MITNQHNKIKAGITIGDINGIGMEVIIKTFVDNRMFEFCTPIIYGSSKIASYHRKAVEMPNISFNKINNAETANPERVNIINCWEEEVKIELGTSSGIAGKYALKSLETAVEGLSNNSIDVLITAPVNKYNIQSKDFDFPGHTEYLAEKFNEPNVIMIMVKESLRVGVVTGHVPLKEVASGLSIDNVFQKIKILNKSLIEDFGIRRSKIAVLGLNPHAGDNGLIGHEEEEVIIPAINKAKEDNILASGPFSADGLFGSSNYTKFDAILAMYHDQGLVPFKILSNGHGVNFTAGLPVVRTSPEHGTAYEIAGKNIASETSFREAVFLACSIHRTREGYKELTANSLKPAVLGVNVN
ncbi:MAG: 4-hydroxythreonine-4-phosphate dehydrogenase PdxA [Bacteroidota bacterium]